MNSIKDRAAQINEAAKKMGKEVYKDGMTTKIVTPRSEYQKESSKVVTLEEAIRKTGLKDGMTISFHHHFRSGDKVVNMVVDKLAEMGFKDLHIASSSLIDVHEPLIRTCSQRCHHPYFNLRTSWQARQRDFTWPDEGACGLPLTRWSWQRNCQRRPAH